MTPQQPYCWLSVKHCFKKKISQASDVSALSIDFASACPFFFFFFFYLFVHVCVFKTKEFSSTKAMFAKNASEHFFAPELWSRIFAGVPD